MTSNNLLTNLALKHRHGVSFFLTFIVLILACILGFSSRLFAVIRFESIIHEFDPWFNYRSTHYMTKNGFYNFLNWFDETAWYPLGRIVGGTVYPGLMLTSNFIHYLLELLTINVHIREICVFLAPAFSGLTAISTYLLTSELWNRGAGLFAACFIAIVPGYISRSVAGSYDNEGIAIFALMFTYYLWIRSIKSGSVFWSLLTALSYLYMVSAWGGYVFIFNLIPLHVFVLILMGRYSLRLYTAYTTFYIIGLLCSMQIPFVGFQPIHTSEHMAAAGVFVLINIVAVLRRLQSSVLHSMPAAELRRTLSLLILIAAAGVFCAVSALTYFEVIAPWSGRFYSLWDTSYAKIHIPIITSVSEHQPTSWSSFFFDLHVLCVTYPVGLWYCIKHVNDERVFIVLYALTAVYFAGVMVRLILVLTPVVCVLSGVAFSHFFSLFAADSADTDTAAVPTADSQLYDCAGKPRAVPQRAPAAVTSVSHSVQSMCVLVAVVMLVLFTLHCTWVTSNAYSSPSVVLATYSSSEAGRQRHILDDFREAYAWLSANTPTQARVMSWWDYGYQIAGMANRTTLVDNNTWNNSHIALVGKAMSSNETAAYAIMRELNVDYVLVIFGGLIGYSGDDINKFLWMVRIAEGEHPHDIQESNYFTAQGEFRVDAGGSRTLLNCLMYKLSYYRFAEIRGDPQLPSGFDRTRGVEIGNKHVRLTYLQEAFTSEHWLVRIYRVRGQDEFVRSPLSKSEYRVKRGPLRVSAKTSRRRNGVIAAQK